MSREMHKNVFFTQLEKFLTHETFFSCVKLLGNNDQEKRIFFFLLLHFVNIKNVFMCETVKKYFFAQLEIKLSHEKLVSFVEPTENVFHKFSFRVDNFFFFPCEISFNFFTA